MEGYYYTRGGHVPAFGSWDWNTDHLQFTECFESATRAGTMLRYSYSDHEEDHDLYVTGDLYDNHMVTPAMIVVPRRRRKGRSQSGVKEEKKEQSHWNLVDEVKLSPSMPSKPNPKPVDEDLYKIPPELLYSSKSKKKRGFGFFSSCLKPTNDV